MRTILGAVVAAIIFSVGTGLAEEPVDPKPVHVQVQVQFVAVTKADGDTLLRAEAGGIPSKDRILDLVKQGKAKVVCAPSVMTLPGHEATVKAVEECIYPTSLAVEPSPTPPTNAPAAGASPFVVVSPTGFVTREVGVILSCVPEVREDGHISITLAPQLSSKPAWKTYKSKCVRADGKEMDIDLEQPFFRGLSLNTSLMIKDGETIMAGGGMPDGNSETVTFLLVTARLVDASANTQSRK